MEIARGELGNTDGWSYHPGQGDPSDAWCQYFVNRVWRGAGVPDMFGASNIQVGDAVLFGTCSSDPSTSLHVGIVVAVHGDGGITPVDGNYADTVATVGPYFPGSATTHEPGDVYAVVSPE